MGGPEEILKFLDKNPRATALALFAVLVAGAVAGGLYITSLKDALANEREICKARTEIVVARFQADKEAMLRRLNVLRREEEAASLALNRVRDALTAVQLVLVQANLEPIDLESKAQLSAAHRELDLAQQQLSQSTAIAAALASLGVSEGLSESKSLEPESKFSIWIAAFLIVLVSAIGITWLRFRHRSKMSHKATGEPSPNPTARADG